MIRIGVNVSRWGGDVKDALLRIRPGILVVAEPVDWGMLADFRAAVDCLIIFRPVLDGQRPDNGDFEPEQIADYALRLYREHPGLIDAIQPYNEVITTDNVATQGPREIRAVRLIQAAGVPVVALNAGVGNIEPNQIPMLRDIFEEAAAVGCHGYVEPWRQWIDHEGQLDYLQRFETRWAPGHPYVRMDRLILTETGTYYDPGKTGCPWDTYGGLCLDIQQYADNLGMLGTAAFTLAALGRFSKDGTEPWEAVHYPECWEQWAAYNDAHDGPAPRLTIPAQEEPTMALGPSIVTDYPDQHAAWVAAGGWRNFASFMVATGQIEVTDAERREFVIDRLESGGKEAVEFLRSLPL